MSDPSFLGPVRKTGKKWGFDMVSTDTDSLPHEFIYGSREEAKKSRATLGLVDGVHLVGNKKLFVAICDALAPRRRVVITDLSKESSDG